MGSPSKRAAFVSFVLLGAASLGRGEPTLEEIRSGNATAQAAIVTLQARVDVTVRFNPDTIGRDIAALVKEGKYDLEQKNVIEYWRAGEKERVKEKHHVA